MSKGIKITKGKDIKTARQPDEVIDTTLPGSFKVYKSFTFHSGDGQLTTINSAFGAAAYIQRVAHGLDYAPAYTALLSYDDGSLTTTPFNDFISVAGDSHFINVTPAEIIVGFDSFAIDNGATITMKVMIYAEALDD